MHIYDDGKVTKGRIDSDFDLSTVHNHDEDSDNETDNHSDYHSDYHSDDHSDDHSVDNIENADVSKSLFVDQGSDDDDDDGDFKD